MVLLEGLECLLAEEVSSLAQGAHVPAVWGALQGAHVPAVWGALQGAPRPRGGRPAGRFVLLAVGVEQKELVAVLYESRAGGSLGQIKHILRSFWLLRP